MTQQLTFIGLQIGEFLIDDLIGEGAFSWVYHGVHTEEGSQKAFKIAKTLDMVSLPGNDDLGLTEAKYIFSGGVTNVRPDPTDLLLQQAEKLGDCADPGLIKIDDVVQEAGLCYFPMELIEGQGLRELIGSGPVPVQVLIDVATAMARLSKLDQFVYHGDIKPDNILIAADGIKLIDPGFFGLANCQEGEALDCVVTTTAYYPTLKPDDLFAFGIMLWEIACKQHPLRQPANAGEKPPAQIGEGLKKFIRSYENVAQYFLSPLSSINRPSNIRPGLPREVEAVLLKAMRLRIDGEGVIELGAGYETFAELALALGDLVKQNIRSL